MWLPRLDRGEYQRILDVGCGAGSNATWHRKHGAREIVGVELDPTSAARATVLLDRVICEPIETAVRALEGSFDLIVCADVLEHLVDPWSVVHELRRVARADTVLAISMPNIRSLPAILRIAFGRSSPAYFLMATDSWVPQRWGAPRFEKLGLVRRLAQRSTRGRSHEWLAGQLYVIARLGRG